MMKTNSEVHCDVHTGDRVNVAKNIRRKQNVVYSKEIPPSASLAVYLKNLKTSFYIQQKLSNSCVK